MRSYGGIEAVSLCWAFLMWVWTPYLLCADRPTVAAGEIDRLVVAALVRQGATEPKVIAHIDLTERFGTESQWTFVAVQERGQPLTDNEEDGPIHVCFMKARSPDCSEDKPYHLLASRVVYQKPDEANSLLFLQFCGARGDNGNCGIATALYRYDRSADRFVRVFQNLTGHNNNEATRFVEHGFLQGVVIVDYPTANAPYTYWIEVYRARDSGEYVRVLRYRGRTGYGDNNPLAVVDSEMPEILRRLGLWKPGDALPIPDRLPRGCTRVYLRKGEEWCR